MINLGNRTNRWCSLALIFLGTFLLSGCEDDSTSAPDLSLLDGPNGDKTAEAERLRRLQLLRYTRIDKQGNRTPAEDSVEDFVTERLSGKCIAEIETANGFSDLNLHCDTTDTCLQGTCSNFMFECQSQLLNEAASLRATNLTLPDLASDGSVIGSIEIPPQSTATRSAMYRVAANYAQQATRGAASILLGIGCSIGGGDLARAFGNSVELHGDEGKIGPQMGTLLVDSYHLFNESISSAVDTIKAAGDAQFASTASLSVAEQRAIAGDALSRGAAAHLLVGGGPGLPTFPNGFCTSTRLSAQAQAALGLFRTAGISSAFIDAVIEGDIPIGSIVEGPGASVGMDGSVRERLQDLWGKSISSIEDSQGLTIDDFRAAAQYLDDEAFAFGRSFFGTLGTIPGPHHYTKYADLASPPQAPSPAFYGSAARFGWNGLSVPSSSVTYPVVASALPIDITAAPNLAQYVDAVKYTGNFVSLWLKAFLADTTLNTQIQNKLSLLGAAVATQHVGRLVIDVDSQNNLKATVWGYGVSDGLKMVRLPDGLRCATYGSADGDTNCNLTQWTVADFTTAASTPTDVFYDIRAGVKASAAIGNFTGQQAYLLKLKKGVTAAAARRGDYEALAGFSLPNTPSGSSHEIILVPLIDGAEKKIGELLAPSPAWCTHSHVTCADTVFDERLPLEDELSQDTDGVESSWKHYLSLAQQAAAEADLLGSQVIQSGIEYDKQQAEADQIKTQMNLRAEEELEKLQDICGTAVDSHRLLQILSGNDEGDLSNIMGSGGGGSCPQTACPAEWHCTQGTNPGAGGAGICIPDFAALAKKYSDEPDMNRLAQCLETSDVVDFVTLGDKPLCVWVDPNDHNKVCEGSPSPTTTHCPAFMKGSTCVNSDFGFEGTAQAPGSIKDISNTLEIFASDPTAAQGGDKNPCRLIRRLRKHPDDVAAFRELKASNALNPDWIMGRLENALANATGGTVDIAKIGWDQRYRGYSAITFDGAPIFETGSPWTGPAHGGWPCAAGYRSDCTDNDGDGLFCTTYDCTDKKKRAKANDRMMRAVLAMNYIGVDTNVTIGAPMDHVPFGGGSTKLLLLDNGSTFPIKVLGQQDDPVLAAVNPVLAVPFTFAEEYFNSLATTGDAAYSYETPQSGVLSAPSIAVGRWMSNIYPGALQYWARDIFRFTEINLRGLYSIDYDYTLTDFDGNAIPLSPGPRDFLVGGARGPSPYCLVNYPPFSNPFPPSVVALTPADSAANPGSFYRYECDATSQLDALELMCEAARGFDEPSPEAGCGDFPTVSTVNDLGRAKRYLDCIAGQIERKASTSVLTHMPAQAVDLLKQTSGIGSYPSVGGQYGTAIATLRGALIEVSTAGPAIAAELRHLGNDMAELRTKLQINGIQGEIADVQFQATQSAQTAKCTGAIASGVGETALGVATSNPGAVIGGLGSLFGAAVECGDAMAQIHFSEKLRDLEKQQAGLQNNLALDDFSDRFTTHTTALQTLGLKIQEQVETINAQLSTIEGLRSQALRSLSRAMFLSSAVSESMAGVSSVMLARHSLEKVRYQRAFKNAQKMAFTAKRAIEQRLGVTLAQMTDQLPLVDAPARWESTICATTGVDYEALKTTDSKDTTKLENFADGFIGDYVTKLQNVVESYRMVKSFHEGTDTAVLSLRDDVLNIRTNRDCSVPVGNLLFEPAKLDAVANGTRHGWTKVGCATTTSGGVTVPKQNCISVLPLDNDSPFPAGSALSTAPGYHLQIADGTPDCSGAPTQCGFLKDSAIVQRVTLPAGTYRLSWYARGQGALSVVGAVRCNPAATNDTSTCSNPTAVLADGPPLPLIEAPTQWTRFFYDFTLTGNTPESIEIVMREPNSGRGFPVLDPRLSGIDVAAIMLENVTMGGNVVGGNPAPRTFVDTGQTLTIGGKLCEDTDGTEFRLSGFHRGCMKLCPDGFADSCESSRAKTFCYSETQFNINQRDIESGKILTQSGLALGNFNYRIESVGVNFVGSGIKNCSQSTLPSTCYSSGNVPYTIEHWGPYFVRNYDGQDYDAKLFTGRIEHARGLATERYLTNPLSSDDTSLIEQYLRTELQGRPLDGNFILRVWDDDTINFRAIQDIQVVLKYRYWTRFN